MKKLLLLFLLFSVNIFAGGDWATSVVQITLNGGSPYRYILNDQGWTDGDWVANTALQGLSFGTPSSLVLNGGSGNAWTDDSPGYDATSFKLYYRVYLSTDAGGAWSSIDLDFPAYSSGSNRIYDKSGLSINLLALTSGTGTYNLEVVMSKNQFFAGGNWNSMVPGGQGTAYDSTSAGFIATFDFSAVPVELSSFSASITNNTVNLNWATATEINNYGFEVERSLDKTNWNKIAFVNGRGNSNNVNNYAYTDNQITKGGYYYYRLKQLDNDGAFTYSDITEVNINMPSKFELAQNYPNPFNPTTKISYSIPEASSVKMTIYNTIGQVVRTMNQGYKEAGSYTMEFNGSDLNSGIYFYKLEAGKNNQIRKMIMIK